MKYRLIETCYGPDIHYNDWVMEEGRKERAGGMVHIFADPRARARRACYAFGAGGDVAIELTFSFDRFPEDGRLAVVVNDRKRTRNNQEGFCIVLDRQHVTARVCSNVVGPMPSRSCRMDTLWSSGSTESVGSLLTIRARSHSATLVSEPIAPI